MVFLCTRTSGLKLHHVPCFFQASELQLSVSIILGHHILKDTFLDMRDAFASAPSSLAVLEAPVSVECKQPAPTIAKSPASGPSKVSTYSMTILHHHGRPVW